MATNYFINAKSQNFNIKLLSLDSGYLPFFLKIISALFDFVNLPNWLIPYFQTLFAIVFISIAGSIFCLKFFKPIIENDALRFAVAITLILVSPFETTMFFNCTYYSIFPLACLTLISLNKDVIKPNVAVYLMPLLFFGKPYHLCLLPLLFIGVLFAKNFRYRIVFFASIIVLLIQILFLLNSKNSGVTIDPQVEYYTILDKIFFAVINFFGIFFSYLIGPLFANLISSVLYPEILVFMGAFTCFYSLYFCMRYRDFSNVIIFGGLSIVFCCCFINAFSITSVWNYELNILHGVSFSRHAITAFWGSLIAILGLYNKLTNYNFFNKKYKKIIIIIYAIQLFVGYSIDGISHASSKKFPLEGLSAWKENVVNIDKSLNHNKPLCFPINPYGWFFKYNCDVLNKIKPYNDNKITIEAEKFYNVDLPKEISNKEVNGVGFVVSAFGNKYTTANAKIIIKTKTGKIFSEEKKLTIYKKGGLVFFNRKLYKAPIKNIKEIKIKFDKKLEILISEFGSNKIYGIWTGY